MDNADQSIFEDEGSGYLVSVSDIMAGLLFIFIITLMAFVIQFHKESEKKKEVVERLTDNQQVRAQLLSDIKRELQAQGVNVEIDQELGVLRLTEQTVRFRSGKSILDEKPKENLNVISDVLSKVLPCYASGAAIEEQCDPKTKGTSSKRFS